MDHLKKFWSLYLMAVSAVTPFFPMINAAIAQEIGPHAHLKAFMISVSLWLSHLANKPYSLLPPA